MRRSRDAIVNSVWSTHQVSKRNGMRCLMIASGIPDTIGNAVQARTPLKITAPRRAPNNPAQLVSGGLIYRSHRLER